MASDRTYYLTRRVWLAVDTDGHLLAWASEPDGPDQALEAARQVVEDLRDPDDEDAPSVDRVMRDLRLVEVEVRADDLNALARGMTALFWAPGRDRVLQEELDAVDALMQWDPECPHCRGGVSGLGGEDVPCSYCLEPRARS